MYVERLELYFIRNGIEDAGKKRAVLLTVSAASTLVNLQLLGSHKTCRKVIRCLGCPPEVALYPKTVSGSKLWQLSEFWSNAGRYALQPTGLRNCKLYHPEAAVG